jgi:hypothetical protein
MKRSTLEIITPTYYGIALPTIMNNYCTSPYVDDFSNANSGWPITVSNATTYQYNNDEYQIYHGLANRWTAVSIGHVMDNTETMTIEGRLANNRNGVVGIVFGLNNDWSDYYTFEILPHHGLWAVFYFNAQTGWQTIQSGNSGLINAGSQINKLKIEGNGEIQGMIQFTLYVNDNFITWQNAEPGRVGITGSSYVSGVDLRYDNYLFADDNCPVTPPLHGERVLDSFINSDASHPSLNSLLNMNQD